MTKTGIKESGAEPERIRKSEAFGGKNGASVRHGAQSVVDGTIATRNKRTVWTVATQPYPEAHFATYPEDLIEPCILAGHEREGTMPGVWGSVGACPLRWWQLP